MSTPELPPLPADPAAWLHRQGLHCETSERQLDDDEIARGWTQEPLYPAEQVRAAFVAAYRAGRLAGLEEAAKVCDAVDAEEQQEPVCYGFASECATSIRALKEKPE